MLNQPLTGNPIWDLQQMLLVISQEYPRIPSVIPDGIFGENTLEAVMVFQRDFQLPVTGVVDNATWDAITHQYRTTLRRVGTPLPLRVMPNGAFMIQPGEQREQVAIIQAMYNSLAKVFGCFKPTNGDGINQGATVENTRQLQKKCGIPVSGTIDRVTWCSLARLYHMFATRAQ